jgi:Arylsulfotransferase (ASST)
MTRDRAAGRKTRLVVVLAVFAALALGGAIAAFTLRNKSGTRPEPAPAALPAPRPATVRASGAVTVFPLPGTVAASQGTGISFRGIPAGRLAAPAVAGSATGPHPGQLHPHADGRGATFAPDNPFQPGESVTVAANLPVRGAHGNNFTFTVARPVTTPDAPLPNAPKPAPPKPDASLSFASRPDLRPPRLDTVTPARNVAQGAIFLTPSGPIPQTGPLIVDDRGQPLWFAPNATTRTLDLSVQTYRGKPVLTWYEGSVTLPGGYGQGEFVIADEHYREIARVRAGNGYAADLHDFEITPQGSALFTIYSRVHADASAVGGAKDQPLIDTVVQEVDIPTGAVLFEWHSLGTIGLQESYEGLPKDKSTAYDYVHPNSVTLDSDNTVLISGRHTWSVFKIDRGTGALVWRLGGKQSNFSMGDGAAFAWQHDVRRQPDSTLTVFDNGASVSTKTHPTRGLVLRVDEHAMTASLVREYKNPHGSSATSQGDFQALANGNFLAGWGSLPEYTEFAAGGTVLADTKFPAGASSYRAFRFRWTGHPLDAPSAVAIRAGGDVAVSASWNGATEIATWRVLAGTNAGQLEAVRTAPRDGFETTVHLTTGEPYVAMQALDSSGAVLGTSAPVAVAAP